MHKIIFLHIPKTAGSTFRQIIKRNYACNEMFGLDGEQKIQTGQKFSNLTNTEREDIKFLGGHLNFGLHNYFNDKENCKYITFLREPIQREISYYNYVLRIPQHVHHKEVVAKKMSLEDYILSDLHKDIADAQSKQIIGIHVGLQSDSIASVENILPQAKSNIRNHFVFSGITEQFDEGVILLNKILDWKFPLYYKSINTAPNNQKYSNISERVIQLIADQNQSDILLYEFVKKQFHEQIEQHREYINRQLRLLKIFNFLYNSYNKIRNK